MGAGQAFDGRMARLRRFVEADPELSQAMGAGRNFEIAAHRQGAAGAARGRGGAAGAALREAGCEHLHRVSLRARARITESGH